MREGEGGSSDEGGGEEGVAMREGEGGSSDEEGGRRE